MNKLFILILTTILSAILSYTHAQQIVFALDYDSIGFGFPGNEIAITGTITNNDSVNIDVFVERMEENIPSGWLTYFCTDVCLLPTTSFNTVNVHGGYVQEFSFHFITNSTPDSGNALMQFTNLSNSQNFYNQRLYGITDSAYSNIGNTHLTGNQEASLYPNPLTGNRWLTIRFAQNQLSSSQSCEFILYDILGHVVGRTSDISHMITVLDLSYLSHGTYTYSISFKEPGQKQQHGKLIVR